jgi:hypothetical protein
MKYIYIIAVVDTFFSKSLVKFYFLWLSKKNTLFIETKGVLLLLDRRIDIYSQTARVMRVISN